jgi:hypothetical protein
VAAAGPQSYRRSLPPRWREVPRHSAVRLGDANLRWLVRLALLKFEMSPISSLPRRSGSISEADPRNNGAKRSTDSMGSSRFRAVELSLAEGLKGVPNLRPDCAARALIEQLRGRNFILCSVGGRSYAFVHRTFLAAIRLARSRSIAWLPIS